jgi:hypothetical protein
MDLAAFPGWSGYCTACQRYAAWPRERLKSRWRAAGVMEVARGDALNQQSSPLEASSPSGGRSA